MFRSGRWALSSASSAEVPAIRLMATSISTVSGSIHPHDPSPFVHPREDCAAYSDGHRFPCIRLGRGKNHVEKASDMCGMLEEENKV